jgi:pyruvate-ferredoxin/flavodoxin oxidoreductase
MSDEELAAAPAGTQAKPAIGKELAGYKFRIQVSPLDCTGCSNCANVCPAPNKALVMKPLEEQLQNGEEARWEYMHRKVGYKDTVVDKTKTVKNSQFSRPLFEFSGACAGCGETPYIKAITQLFGHRMIIANATGCSSIYGGSAPSSPYCSNDKGFGPAWANSLFEDNAEFGLGILSGVAKQRERLCILMREAIENGSTCSAELKSVMTEWIDNRKDATKSEEIAERLIPMMEACNCPICQQILELKHYLIKKSIWIIGGDGWAYDIGFGGLDHVIASGKNVNILVLDTEVYSNTGGQSSKSTPIGAVAKFASAGKRVRKKDLGAMAMTYSYVYVAQVAMGANHNQYFQAIKEAEAYNGPSLIIAYAPCINHGIKGGMGLSQMTEKQAVESGYWHLWRYNPTLPEQGKNPFILDSKEPDWSKFQEFIHKEVRYTSLLKTFPKEAEELFAASESDAKWRYDTYKRYVAMDYSNEKKE